MKPFDCDVYIDLMPLVKDGAASAATGAALRDHLAECESCRTLYESLPAAPAAPDEAGAAKTLARLRRQLALGLLTVAVVGAAVGLALNGGEFLFYNVLILPAVGCAAYYALRRYSLLAPVGMFALSFVWFVIQAVASGQLVLNADGSLSLSNLLGGAAVWSLLYTGVFCVGVVLGFLSHLAFSRTKRLPKLLRVALAAAAMALTCGILYSANGLVGNPVCKAIARNHAEKMLVQEFAGLDLEIEKASFNFKDGGYYVRVRSDSSIDTHFTIYYNGWGQYKYDTYDSVTDGWNTYNRLSDAYRAAVKEALNALYGDPSIGYGDLLLHQEVDAFTPVGELPGMEPALLQVDGQYDLAELGAQYGEVVLYLDQEEVTVEEAARVLLQLRGELDARGIRFHCIDLVLEKPRKQDGTPSDDDTEVRIEDFRYADIYAEGLVERVQAAHDALTAWYAARDAENAALFANGGEAIDTEE